MGEGGTPTSGQRQTGYVERPLGRQVRCSRVGSQKAGVCRQQLACLAAKMLLRAQRAAGRRCDAAAAPVGCKTAAAVPTGSASPDAASA